MKTAYWKNILRTIRKSFGRYVAILAIIALGVGFFSGLKAAKPSMMKTGQEYVRTQKLYDLELISTWGFDKEEVEKLSDLSYVEEAEGAVSEDFLYQNEEGEEKCIHACSITEKANLLTLTAGQLPKEADECVLDATYYTEDMIGGTITLSSENSDETKESFTYDTYTVTGLVRSPLYLNVERGTTSIGSGKVSGFMFLLPEGFQYDYFEEIYVTGKTEEEAFSDEYEEDVEALQDTLEEDAENIIEKRYQETLDALPETMASSVAKPVLYVLDRSTNVGYASFESDVSIVDGVAKIFPIFFFLIAALVCSTTMTRMVEDERTQIGTLRALGYTKGAILTKYMIYSGTAAVIGASVGYRIGTLLFPWTIWTAYGMLYGFADLVYAKRPVLFVISMLVSLLCSAGTTYASCYRILKDVPAELIRPKMPSAGKRILLERIPWLWGRLKFLHKVSARNIFRFKKRMFMMLLGIAGCTSLVIAGFGVKDSIANVANDQFDKILTYDVAASYTTAISNDMKEIISKEKGKEIENCVYLKEQTVEAVKGTEVKTVYLMIAKEDDITACVNFAKDGETCTLPGKGEILIDQRLADAFSLKVGDTVTLRSGDQTIEGLAVSGIFENHIYYYAYINADTYEEYFDGEYAPSSLYLNLTADADPYEMGTYLSETENASTVTVVDSLRTRVENMMSSMNYVVAIVILSAAALAFIVLFNLGNINITERVREIATLKVLGFYPNETASYVFRENIVLSGMGIILGLPLGTLLHRFIMEQIRIDMVSFQIQILPRSYFFSVVAVLVFTICVDLILRRKIDLIDMAESLKSME